jgi:hypothetical protein
MNGFFELFGFNVRWQDFLPVADGSFGNASMIVVVAMCCIGTFILNKALKVGSVFNTVVNFSGLLVGAYVASIFARSWQLNGIDSVVMVAIIANAGMSLAALALIVCYRNSNI